MNWQNQLKKFLFRKGFNIFGICSIESYNQSIPENNRFINIFPTAKSMIIFGSGGKYFWEIFNKFRKSQKGIFLKDSVDPIDSYTEFVVSPLLIKYHELISCIYPFKTSDFFIDFQKLAVCTGTGHFSPYIKLVLHPVFGPWLSLRGAFLTDLELEPTLPLSTSVPCLNCFKPCLEACPIQAVSANNFDFKICSDYRNLEKDCLSHCHVRTACIIGPEHSYTQEEGLHRNKSALKILRNYYKIKKP